MFNYSAIEAIRIASKNSAERNKKEKDNSAKIKSLYLNEQVDLEYAIGALSKGQVVLISPNSTKENDWFIKEFKENKQIVVLEKQGFLVSVEINSVKYFIKK